MIDAGVLSGTTSLVARAAGFRELGDLAELGLHYPMAPIGKTKAFLQKHEALVQTSCSHTSKLSMISNATKKPRWQC